MIDTLDTQTQSLPLEPKRGRGRPATGQALSNAERQRAYRERQKAQRNEKHYEELIILGNRADQAEEKRQEALARIRELEAKIDAAVTAMNEAIGARKFWEKEANHHRARAEALEQRIYEAERELAQRNEKPAKARKHRDDAPLKTIMDAHKLMEDRRKSGELSDMDALWRFVGATLQVIEQHGITTPK